MDSVDVTDECAMLRLGVSARLMSVVNGERYEHSFQLVPRSSIYKKGLIMANSVGIIDKSYRGELKAPVWSMTKQSRVEAGERLFQIVLPTLGHIKHVRIVTELPETERGANGFGSSGK
jgi:dUTP pyrophosphatase